MTLLISRLVLSLILSYAFYIVWTRNVDIPNWFKKSVEDALPISEPNPNVEHEKAVNLLISSMSKGNVFVFLDLNHEIDKIGDISLYIKLKSTKDIGGGRINLRNVRGFVYRADSLLKPFIKLKEIDAITANYRERFGDYEGESIVLEWRDGQNNPHRKEWPFTHYKDITETLKSKGLIESPTSSSSFLSEVNL